MAYQFLKSILLISFPICILWSCNQGSKDYQKNFGDKYTEAENYFVENNWITDTLRRHNVDPSIACSIVFPEVMRYSSLRDFAETKSLEVLYIQYGSKYADFSIGRFQMKPSFAAKLEKDWLKLMEKEIVSGIIRPSDTVDDTSSRILRINRLKDQEWQVRYLVMYCKVVDIRFHDKLFSKNIPDIEFLASAYNLGYWCDSIQITNNEMRNYYYTGIFKPKECLNYCDISVYYYKKCRGKLGTN